MARGFLPDVPHYCNDTAHTTLGLVMTSNENKLCIFNFVLKQVRPIREQFFFKYNLLIIKMSVDLLSHEKLISNFVL